MAIVPVTLNQYNGTDKLGNISTIVAESMEIACNVYAARNNEDPVVMQVIKEGIQCVMPETYTTFKTVVSDPTGAASKVCKATPETYTLSAGTKQVFTAQAAEGWQFVKWQIDGVDVAGDEGTSPVAYLTIPPSTNVVIITAVFRAGV